MKRFTGSCLCGGITYEILGLIGKIVHCHCSMCRKWHGSTFRTRITVSSHSFRWTRGEGLLGRYRSSEKLTKTFCKNCGSSMATFYSHMPDIVGLSLGTLNEDPERRPEFHVFVGSKAPWWEINDDLPQYEAFPEDPKDVYRLEEPNQR